MMMLGHWTRAPRAFLAVVATLLLSQAIAPRTSPATAQVAPTAGQLDPTYGTGGRVILDRTLPANDQSVSDILVQPDGKILVLGFAPIGAGYQVFVSRALPNGQPDLSFGKAGSTFLAFYQGELSTGTEFKLGLQPNGNIVVSKQFGSNTPDLQSFPLRRLHPNGDLDLAFLETNQVPATRLSKLMAVLRDGRFLEASVSGAFGLTARPLVLRRYSADGAVDQSYGMGGVLEVGLGESNTIVLEPPVVLAGGNVLIVGRFRRSSDLAISIVLVRLTSAGVPDEDFGQAGVIIRDLPQSGPPQDIRRIETLPDGRILIRSRAGNQTMPSLATLSITRLLPNGLPDTGFGQEGVATPGITEVTVESASRITMQSDGGILLHSMVISGTFGNLQGPFSALVRLDATGNLDRNYGPILGFGQQVPALSTLVQDSAGRLLGGAWTSRGYGRPHRSESGIAVFRLDPRGTADLTFGQQGTAVLAGAFDGFQPAPSAAQLQLGDRLLVGGHARLCDEVGFPFGRSGPANCGALIRLDTNGGLDRTFNLTGTLPGVIEKGYHGIAALSVMTNGEFSVAGHNYFLGSRWPAVERYDSTGKSLGTPASYPWEPSKAVLPVGIAPDADGSWVLSKAGDPLGSTQFYLERFAPSGNRANPPSDPLLSALPGIASASPSAMVRQTDGKMLASGEGQVITGAATLGIVSRYTVSGTRDVDFGTSGVVSGTFGFESARFRSLAVQSDGKILAVGSATTGTGSSRFLITRLLGNGSPDPAFGQNGVSSTTFGEISATANAVVTLPDGRFVVAGTVGKPRAPELTFPTPDPVTGSSYIAIVRYLPNGAPDPTFGASGVITMSLGGTQDSVESLVLQPDGKLLVVGTVGRAGQPPTLGVARLTNVDLAHYATVTNVLLRFTKPT